MKDFDYVRRATYFKALADQMRDNTQPNGDALRWWVLNANKTESELFSIALPKGPEIDWYAIEEPWTLRHNTYTSAPESDPIEMAKKVMRFLSPSPALPLMGGSK